MVVNPEADPCGTVKVGVVKLSFPELVEKLGYPEQMDQPDKSRVEWILEHEGRVMTIYDWDETCPVEDVLVWNVGGKSILDWVNVSLFLGV